VKWLLRRFRGSHFTATRNMRNVDLGRTELGGPDRVLDWWSRSPPNPPSPRRGFPICGSSSHGWRGDHAGSVSTAVNLFIEDTAFHSLIARLQPS
jgi:hypothetical protein